MKDNYTVKYEGEDKPLQHDKAVTFKVVITEPKPLQLPQGSPQVKRLATIDDNARCTVHRYAATATSFFEAIEHAIATPTASSIAAMFEAFANMRNTAKAFEPLPPRWQRSLEITGYAFYGKKYDQDDMTLLTEAIANDHYHTLTSAGLIDCNSTKHTTYEAACWRELEAQGF